MGFLDLCVLSGLAYSIFGNIYNYIKNKPNIEKNIKELKGETDILEIYGFNHTKSPPTFISTGSTGLIIPISGGSTIEERQIYTLLTNKSDKIINKKEVSFGTIFETSYINNNDDLTDLYNKYNISTTSFPVSYPLKIYKRKTTSPVYYNRYYYDSNKSKLVNHTLFKNRKPLTFIILGSCVAVLAFDWYDYKICGKYYYTNKNNYPIFHPQRYSTIKENLKKSIKSWLEQ